MTLCWQIQQKQLYDNTASYYLTWSLTYCNIVVIKFSYYYHSKNNPVIFIQTDSPAKGHSSVTIKTSECPMPACLRITKAHWKHPFNLKATISPLKTVLYLAMNNHSPWRTPERQDLPSARAAGKHGYHILRTSMVRTEKVAICMFKY